MPKPLPEHIEDIKEYVRNVVYENRCARCGTPSKVIHEIEPRSLRPADWWELDNMVVLCSVCHTWAEELGTRERADELRQCRERVLRERGMV